MSEASSTIEVPGRVLLCVCGGIAAYKAPELVRSLVKAGLSVQVVMTPAAEAFATPMALATVSKRPVRRSLLDVSEEGQVGHIELADWPDLVIVAPATADILARATAGMADDLVSTCLLATRAPVLWAPAMNTNMWRHPATQSNLATLRARGNHFVGPDAGELACGWVGEGRMIDPPLIVDAALSILKRQGARDGSWAGRSVLVSAGPTRAYLDPVRFVTNASTGAMGFAIAELAAARGANVTLVSGPVDLPTPPGVRRTHVETAEQMLEAMDEVLREAPQDLVAMVAAVSDVQTKPSDQKLPKDDLIGSLNPETFVPAVDVLATLTKRHGANSFFLGFGAQTVERDADVAQTLLDVGTQKLERKGCQALFVNRVGVPGSGFNSATNTGLLLRRQADGTVSAIDAGPLMPKRALAGWILDQLSDGRRG